MGELIVADRIHPKSNRFNAGLTDKAAGDSQLNNSSVLYWVHLVREWLCCENQKKLISSI